MARAGRLLIVNADDYGLTDAISRGILRGHRDGVVTSASVLAVGPAAARTARWLAGAPRLGVGGHLALVGEDPPVLTAREVPTLVDRRGRLPLTWRAFLARAAAGRVDPADVRHEFAAQLDRLTRELGLRLTHLDSHQHLHLWPPVARALIDLAVHWRVPAVRLPASSAGGPKGRGVRHLSGRLAAALRQAGLAAPGGYAGLDEAGGLTAGPFTAALRTLAASPARTAEINCHPGAPADPDRARYAWDYQWEAELATLTSPALRRAIGDAGFRLATYADLR